MKDQPNVLLQHDALPCLMSARSLPQAWAVFKGKFKEGDKAEPATWKTRLRCALNKSPDFEEVTDRSQLDITEPYKVYRIVPEDEQKREFVSLGFPIGFSYPAVCNNCSSENHSPFFFCI